MKVKNPLRVDPSRTSMLRRKFLAEVRKRAALLKKKVYELIVKDDVLGLNPIDKLVFHGEKAAWKFRTDADKLKAFNKWFEEQVKIGVLDVDAKGDIWANKYVGSSYKKGLIRSYQETHSEALAEKPDFFAGSKAQFLESAFNQPERISKIKLLATRVFEDLKGYTAAMSQQTSRVLADGMANGLGPGKIAKNLSDSITGITRKRAEVIARTEVMHAHAEGQLDGYEEMGLTEVELMAEWSTAGDEKVCDECEPLEGIIMLITEARGLIPRHPNCRCTWMPSIDEEKNKEAKEDEPIKPVEEAVVIPPVEVEEEEEEEAPVKKRSLFEPVASWDTAENVDLNITTWKNDLKEHDSIRRNFIETYPETDKKAIALIGEGKHVEAQATIDAWWNEKKKKDDEQKQKDTFILKELKEKENQINVFLPVDFSKIPKNNPDYKEHDVRRVEQILQDDILSMVPKNRPMLYSDRAGLKNISWEQTPKGVGGYYNMLQKEIVFSKDTKGQKYETNNVIPHEYGHHMQFNYLVERKNSRGKIEKISVGEAEKEFQDRRTVGEAYEELPGFAGISGEKVMGKKDKWNSMDKDDFYGGRLYGGDLDKVRQEASLMPEGPAKKQKNKEVDKILKRRNKGGETFCRGLEHLRNRPLEFLETDPEWFAFTVKMLKGVW